jgi:hypothetical protein
MDDARSFETSVYIYKIIRRHSLDCCHLNNLPIYMISVTRQACQFCPTSQSTTDTNIPLARQPWRYSMQALDVRQKKNSIICIWSLLFLRQLWINDVVGINSKNHYWKQANSRTAISRRIRHRWRRIKLHIVWFHVLAEVLIKNTVFWDMTPYSSVRRLCFVYPKYRDTKRFRKLAKASQLQRTLSQKTRVAATAGGSARLNHQAINFTKLEELVYEFLSAKPSKICFQKQTPTDCFLATPDSVATFSLLVNSHITHTYRMFNFQ